MPKRAKLALVANRSSGSGEAESVADLLREAGGELVGEFTLEQRSDAARAGAKRIVLAGGDGSIGCVAEIAAAAGLDLAVVPAGTANDFAAALDLPADVPAACELAVRGARTRRFDLGMIGSRAFVNAAAIGLSPPAARAASSMKPALGPLAYGAGALRAGLSADPVSCRVICDGEVLFEGEAWQAIVAVTGAFGSGADVDADPRSGLLDVVVVEARSRAQLIPVAYGLRAGSVEDQDGVVAASAGEVRVEVDPGTPFNVDGEVIDAGTADFTVVPRAFEVVVG